MPTFTDASLIAAGAGLLPWSMLAVERSARRRTAIGLLGFVALEAAVLVRYTNLVLLAVAVIAVLLVFRRAALPVRSAGWWLGSVAVLGVVTTGYGYAAYAAPAPHPDSHPQAGEGGRGSRSSCRSAGPKSG